MNRKTITMLATAAVLLKPAAVHAEGTVTASADCEALNVDLAGFPDGTAVFVSEGHQPPFGFVVGTGPFWDLTPQPGGGSGPSTSIPVGSRYNVAAFPTYRVRFASPPLKPIQSSCSQRPVDGSYQRVWVR